MVMVYADTSVVVSLVMFDEHSAAATELIEGGPLKLAFTDLLGLEVSNAIRLAVGGGRMTEVEGAASSRQADSMKTAVMVEMELDWMRVFARAMGFSRAHSSVIKSRTLDILHVAAAVELGVTEFWTFDKRQRALAAEVGLRVNA